MLPTLIAQLPADRKRFGLRKVQMAGLLGLTYRQYLALEAGEFDADQALCEQIIELCGWPRGSLAARESAT